MTGTFVVRVQSRFEAAHFLRTYRGPAEPLHGHSYKVEAELVPAVSGLDNDAIAVDFVAAKRELDMLAKRLDYCCINDKEPFTELSPSAENIARWFHGELSSAMMSEHALVRTITLWEGPFNSVVYAPSEETGS